MKTFAELIPFLVAAQIAPRHVEADRFLEGIAARVPDVGRAEIAAQQADHVVEDDGAGVSFRTQPFQARDDIAEQAQFAAADIANDGRHRPAPSPPLHRANGQPGQNILGRKQACQGQEAFERSARPAPKTAVKGTIRAGRRSAADEDTIITKPDVTATRTDRPRTEYAHPRVPCDACPALARDFADDEEQGDVLQQCDGPTCTRLVRDHEAARNKLGLTRPEIRRLNYVSSPLIGV